MKPRTIIVTGARAPAALHIGRIFKLAGWRVVLADTFRTPMSRASRMIDGYVQLPAPRTDFAAYADVVRDLVAREQPDLVVPTCEEIFYLAAARDRRGVPLPLFAPSLDLLARVHNKAEFAALSIGHGADAPETIRLATAGDVARIATRARSLVLKPAWSRFGSRVLIRPSLEQLATIRPTAADPWVAQAYLPGEEISAYGVAHRGRLLAFQAYKPTYRVGLGAGVAFVPVVDEVSRAFASSLSAALGWSGQISFDFSGDADGQLRVIECNPRATGGVHYFGGTDGLDRAMLGTGAATASETAAMTLPLAMIAYGLPHAWRNQGIKRWWRDFRAMQDLSAWPGDCPLLGAQLRALGEIAVLAMRNRSGLVEASVRDIEWDGEDLG